jgi:hypothetical protein
MGVLRNYSEGATVSFVAQALGLAPEAVAPVMEHLYVSSMVECRRPELGNDVYRLPRWN